MRGEKVANGAAELAGRALISSHREEPVKGEDPKSRETVKRPLETATEGKVTSAEAGLPPERASWRRKRSS